MKKFKIIKINDGYIIKKRNFLFFYETLHGSVLYKTENEAMTYIHTLYYPDECDIKYVDLLK